MGIQVAEAILAMINAGVYACGYWTFSDFPFPNTTAIIQTNGDLSDGKLIIIRQNPVITALGLLTKFFRGPSEAYEVISSDSLIRIAAIKNLETGSISIAVINRNDDTKRIKPENERFRKNGKPFRKYLYDPANVPFNYFGDLQSYTRKISLEKRFHFRYGASTVACGLYNSL